MTPLSRYHLALGFTPTAFLLGLLVGPHLRLLAVALFLAAPAAFSYATLVLACPKCGRRLGLMAGARGGRCPRCEEA